MRQKPLPECGSLQKTDWGRWKKHLPLLLALGGLFYGGSQLFRMLWFDEILTVNLILKLPPAKIYYAYEIPNNHILFTMLEKIWFSCSGIFPVQSYVLFRIPVMVMGFCAIFLLSRVLLKKYPVLPVCAVCGAFVCSSVWAHYSTAVRGYMQGFFLTTCAFIVMKESLRHRSGGKYLLLYGLFCLLSLGTVPSNLAALAGIPLYFLGEVRQKKLWKIWICAFLLPLPALGLFYIGILPKFLGCIRLGEGWFSRSNAIYALYTGALFPIAMILPFVLAGGTAVFCKASKTVRFRIICDLLILVMPVGGFLLMKVPPFPRVFFPLTVLWICIFVKYLSHWMAYAGKRKRLLLYAVLILQGIWTVFFFQDKAVLAGNFLYGKDGKGDDYIAPYYTRSDFTPGKVVRFIRELHQSGQSVHVFATFDADAPSLLFAARLQGLEENVLFMDVLNRPRTLRFELFPGDLYIIAAGEKDLKKTLERFSFRNGFLIRSFGMQKIYKVIR